MNSAPWVEYGRLIHIDGERPESLVAAAARMAMEGSPQVAGLLEEIGRWPGVVLNSHASASQTFHAFSFAAYLGVSPGHPSMKQAAERILAAVVDDGMPRLPLPGSAGREGAESAAGGAWALCDAPVVLTALVRLGYGNDAKVRSGVATVASLAKPFGWPCAVSRELGSFRGPGRKDEPCPYATLASLELAAACAEAGFVGIPVPAVEGGIRALLLCLERSREWHPYQFHAGTDFRKLKAPSIWYDALHVLDVLSRFPSARHDQNVGDLLRAVRGKRRPDGTYAAESAYKRYKDWDFGAKGEPSPWISLMIERIERHVEDRA